MQTNTNKPCLKCHEVKPLDGFYKNVSMADGRVNICTDCDRTMGATHPCTCGANEARKLIDAAQQQAGETK